MLIATADVPARCLLEPVRQWHKPNITYFAYENSNFTKERLWRHCAFRPTIYRIQCYIPVITCCAYFQKMLEFYPRNYCTTNTVLWIILYCTTVTHYLNNMNLWRPEWLLCLTIAEHSGLQRIMLSSYHILLLSFIS